MSSTQKKGATGYYAVSEARTRVGKRVYKYFVAQLTIYHPKKHRSFRLGNFRSKKVAAFAADMLTKHLHPDSDRLNNISFPAFDELQELYNEIGEKDLLDLVVLVRSLRKLKRRKSD